MNATSRHPRPIRPSQSGHRSGFTLVEILVVIVIIGILMGIAIPAVTIAINRGKTVAMKLEVDSIKDAINQYEQKYGDYPPDFSSWTIVERHYRKIFPRISPAELNLLQRLLDANGPNDIDSSIAAATHNPFAMDRGEVLAWVLGGYSDNPINPFTGAGGPLELVDRPDGAPNGVQFVYQINTDRPNKLFDFDPSKLDLNAPNAASAMNATNRYLSSDGDLFAQYSAGGSEPGPYVYFDSRTYALFDPNSPNPGTDDGDFNGYGSTTFGVVRPYLSENQNPNLGNPPPDYGSLDAALRAWDFMNPDTFQIIAPGLDGVFGAVAYREVDSSNNISEPLYFQYPSGAAIAPRSDVNAPGRLAVTYQLPNAPAGSDPMPVEKYLERVIGGSENFQQDNIGDFSNGKLVDDVP